MHWESEQRMHALETWGAVSPERLRAVLLEGFRRWCVAHETSTCGLIEVARLVAGELSEIFGIPLRPGWDEALVSPLQYDDPYLTFVEIISSLERGGYLLRGRTPNDGVVQWVRITPRGRALFTADGDHPLSPGFMRRLCDRCPGLPDEVADQFQDALDCLEHGLLRPAVKQIGLAYETAVEAVGVALANKSYFDRTKFEDAAAWLRIDMVKKALQRMAMTKGDRGQIDRAIDFVEIIRDRRNDGGHTRPRWPFNDVSEVESLITQAGMQLPTLWLVIAKA